MNTPPFQPNLPPNAAFPDGIVRLVWNYWNATCANPCTFNGQNVHRHLISYVIKTDVLSIRLVPTIFLSNDVLAGRAGTTPASPTDDLVVKYTLPHSLDHHLTLIDGTNPATRLSTYAQWSKHVLSTAFNNLYLSYHIYPTPDELHIASLCEEGLWEGESCHISTIFVKTIFTKLDDMVVMLDRAAHLNYIRAEFWDCPTDLIYNQIPDVANPGARLQTEPTFMLETPMPATPGGPLVTFEIAHVCSLLVST